jgi:CDP-diacylglycerol---serine O-phosphatidyltransferase
MNKHIPSFFTSLNLLCGCFAIAFASKYYYSLALNFIVIAAVFDFIDGVSARLLNAKSEFGKQLDSLSDVVSFGVAPAFMIFQFMNQNKSYLPDSDLNSILPYFAFLIPVFSALRLAKFNIDTRQSEYFIGLPTPANGLFFASLPFVDYQSFALIDIGQQFKYLFSNNYFLLILTVIFSYLLISNIKLFSLKFKILSWHDNQIKYLFLIISFIFIILFSVQSIPLIILLYIGMSVIDNLITIK